MAGLVVVSLATEAAAGSFELAEELEAIAGSLAVELAEVVEFDMIAPRSRNYDMGEIYRGFSPQ